MSDNPMHESKTILSPSRRMMLCTAVQVGAAAAMAPLTAVAATHRSNASLRHPPATPPVATGLAVAQGVTPYVDGQIPGTPGPGEVIDAYGAPSPKAKIVPIRITRRPIGPHDVQIDNLWAGICHTDIHYVNNDFKNTIYPLVPGHEVVGRVSAVGSDVTDHKIGDIVGVGPLIDNCYLCPSCMRGLQQYCTGPKGITNAFSGPLIPDGTNTYGGYSTRLVVGDQYAFKVPTNLDVKSVAPILCAGLTTYSPLKHWNAGPGKRIGIVGMGGLGHMAVKLASAMGADVTVFSSSPEKEKDALDFGAKAFVLHKDQEAMKKREGDIDVLLNFIPDPFDPNPFVNLIARDGTFVTVGHVGQYATPTDNAPLVFQRRSMAGSFIGSLEESREVLAFCGAHNITPQVEAIKMGQVDDAYLRLRSGKVRYRYVIDVARIA